jgi:hypothetical protein
VGVSWGSNPGTAPPVIKDLLNRPWNTLAVIAACGEDTFAVYVGWRGVPSLRTRKGLGSEGMRVSYQDRKRIINNLLSDILLHQLFVLQAILLSFSPLQIVSTMLYSLEPTFVPGPIIRSLSLMHSLSPLLQALPDRKILRPHISLVNICRPPYQQTATHNKVRHHQKSPFS